VPARLRTRAAGAGVSLAVVAALCFSTLTIFATFAFEAGVDVTTLLAGRFTLGSAIFWLLVRRSGLALPGIRLTLAGLALGAVGYATEAGLFFAALDRMRNAALLEILMYAYPALVTVAVVAMGRERLTRRRVAALCVSTLGVVLVLAGSGGAALDTIGLAMAGGATLLYTGYVLAVDVLLRRTNPLVVATLVTTGAAAGFVVTGLATGSLDTDVPARGALLIVVMTLLSTVIAVLCSYASIKRLGPSKASIVATVEPPATAALAALFLGVALTPVQVAGGALVLSSVAILQARMRVPRRLGLRLRSG
jgi:drug/metabolite transporter (DMT)-like permease